VRFVGTCPDIDELKQAEAKKLALLEIINATEWDGWLEGRAGNTVRVQVPLSAP